MVAILTILACGAMGLIIAAFGHASITRERRSILEAQGQIAAEAEAKHQLEVGAKPAPSLAAKVLGRRSKFDVQRNAAAMHKQKRLRMK